MLTESERLTCVQHPDELAGKLVKNRKMSPIILKIWVG